MVHEPGFGHAAQVQDDLQQVIALVGCPQRLLDRWAASTCSRASRSSVILRLLHLSASLTFFHGTRPPLSQRRFQRRHSRRPSSAQRTAATVCFTKRARSA